MGHESFGRKGLRKFSFQAPKVGRPRAPVLQQRQGRRVGVEDGQDNDPVPEHVRGIVDTSEDDANAGPVQLDERGEKGECLAHGPPGFCCG